MLACYYFQGDHGESLEKPNAFMLANSEQRVTFGDFLNRFPMPASNLHFRFQREDKLSGYVWQDMTNENDVLPLYKGRAVAKILRLNALTELRRRSRLKLKASVVQTTSTGSRFAPYSDTPLPSSSSARPTNEVEPTQPVKTAPKPVIKEVKPVQQEPKPSTPAAATPKPPQSENFFGDFDSSPVQSAPPAAPESRPATTNAYVPSADDIDDSTPANTASSNDLSSLSANISHGLALKMEIDERTKSAAEEMDQARAKLEKQMDGWVAVNGKKRNIRALLSSMHDIVNWPNSGWKPVGLGDLLEPKKVKLHYRKAMMVVHPDKSGHLPAEARYIGRRVFEGINDAYHEFEEKEGNLL